MSIDLFDNKPNKAPASKKRIAELERILLCLIRAHGKGIPCVHPDTGEDVPDIEFDEMRDELVRLDPDSSILRSSSYAEDPNAKKVKHDPPMVSISKANGKQEVKEAKVEKWIRDMADRLGLDQSRPETWAIQSYKRDGVACALYYENGRLIKAGLRPQDNIHGEDVTENVKYVSGVPEKLPIPISCSIRGEIECAISTFQAINGTDAVDGQEFANTRNYSTGSIRQFKDTTITKKRKLNFTAYTIESFDQYKDYYSTAKERSEWAREKLGIPFVTVKSFSWVGLKDFEDGVLGLDFEVDGAVIEVDDLDLQEQAGREGDSEVGNPRGKIAWKFPDDIAEPYIKEIVWEVGRTGRITPVFTFDPVRLAGTMVSRAAGYSIGFMIRNQVRVGTKVRIRKSGKIIPESLGFFDDSGRFIDKNDLEGGSDNLPKDFDFSDFDYPERCISCGEPTSIDAGQKHGLFDLICNNSDCPARSIRMFVHYLQTFGVKGIGEDVVGKLIEHGLVTKFSDLYELKVSDVLKVIGSLRTSLLSVARIHMVEQPESIKDNKTLAIQTTEAIKRKKRIPLAKFFASLGISGSGKTAGRELAAHFLGIEPILTASEDDLLKVDGVGPKAAKSICKYLDKHVDEVRDLCEKHIELELPKTGRFTNKTFVFTGAQPEGKEYWRDRVEKEGGRVSSSVSKKTDYVIIGSDPGQKADKARDLKSEGHPIVVIENNDQLSKLFD